MKMYKASSPMHKINLAFFYSLLPMINMLMWLKHLFQAYLLVNTHTGGNPRNPDAKPADDKANNFIAPLLFRGAAYKLSIRVGKHDLDLFSQACNGMNPSNVFRDRNRGGVPQLVFLYGSTPFLNRTSPEIPLILQWEKRQGC